MLLTMWQNMMLHGTERKNGKMKIFVIALFTALLTLAMRSGDWLAYIITIIGFTVVFHFLEEI